MVSRNGIRKSSSRRCGRQKSSYLDILKTLLLQNQQIIIQQQNMMFMVMKQLNPGASNLMLQQQHQQQQQLHLLEETLGQQSSSLQSSSQQHQQPQHQSHPSSQQTLNHHQQHQHHSQQHHNNHHQPNINQHQQQQQQPHHGQNAATANQLQDDLDAYLTPATSEQEPLETMVPNMGPDSCALSALLGGDGLMSNNLLYNPSTDFGSITPYKGNNSNSHQHHPLSINGQNQLQPQQHETPSYYSSGCESLTTPRVEQQRQSTTYISQNVVKNLNDSFKSPSKPKISVQILSGSATREMKNNKAKIIQSMNISEFLRQVHNDDSSSKSSTQ